MRANNRSQLSGTVLSVKAAGGMADVRFALPDGQEITARITSWTAERLGLNPGSRAVAIIRSTDIVFAGADSEREM